MQQTGSASLEFDCDVELDNWRSAWAAPKQEWCCKNFQRGCTTPTPAPRPAGCTTPAPTPRPLAVVQPAPVPTSVTTTVTTAPPAVPAPSPAPGCTTSPSFNCDEGFANWEAGWSAEKKEYCCKVRNMGCEGPGASHNFNCDDEFANWEMSWSSAKKKFCCKERGMGCEVAAAQPRAAGIADGFTQSISWPPAVSVPGPPNK